MVRSKTASAAGSLERCRGQVSPVRPGGRAETAVGARGRLTIGVAYSIAAAAPVVHLGRLAGIDAGELEQRQPTDRFLRELDALPEHPWAWPRGAVLNHQRGTVRGSMSGRMPQHRSRQRQHQRHGRADYRRGARRRGLIKTPVPRRRNARPASGGRVSAATPVCASFAVVTIGVGVGAARGVGVAVELTGQASSDVAVSAMPLLVSGLSKNAAGAKVVANSLLYGLEMAPASTPLPTCKPARWATAWSSFDRQVWSVSWFAASIAWIASSSEFPSGAAPGVSAKPPWTKADCR